MKKIAILLLLASRYCAAFSSDFLNQPWTAHWIAVPGAPSHEAGVYHFRRSFELPSKPDRFVVHVSGDNRYQLFVNGRLISQGPARGDLFHWRYETVDLAPYLESGLNVVAAVVWNDGDRRAIAQISSRTGFLLQSDDAATQVVDTGTSWKCIADKAYQQQTEASQSLGGYFAAPPTERFDARAYPWGWQDKPFDDSAWADAEVIGRAAPRNARDSSSEWMLVPSAIPQEELKPEPIQAVRLAENVTVATSFVSGHGPFTVPPHTRASVLLDQGHLTTAFPELSVSGGRDGTATLQYSEAPYTSRHPVVKENRNEVTGKQFYGYSDVYLADGGRHRIYRPLFWRTFRYLQLMIETADEPLTIDELRSVFSAYPFRATARLALSDPASNQDVQQILSTGWRTARLCAHETYMDCPYWEQLQYAGDARIQMLISLYMTGDARLMKNGIALLNDSRTAEGATFSRYPSRLQQYIPPFSLWWIGMVHDYWMYVDDEDFVKRMLPGVRAVLSFYANFQGPSSLLTKMPWWNFADWAKSWKNGEPPGTNETESALIDLQLVLAYHWAADLEKSSDCLA